MSRSLLFHSENKSKKIQTGQTEKCLIISVLKYCFGMFNYNISHFTKCKCHTKACFFLSLGKKKKKKKKKPFPPALNKGQQLPCTIMSKFI